MKQQFIFVLQCILLIGLVSCSSSKNTTDSNRTSGSDYSRYTNLADVLRLQSGVVVRGSGRNVDFSIRGINSINLDTRPLYLVDNIPFGRDYSRVNDAINTVNIRSVRVLKSLAETNRYGEQGRNGVIMISLKTSTNIP